MLPANVRGRTNPVNAAALPELRLALSTGRRLIQAARNVAKRLAPAAIIIQLFPTAMFRTGRPATIVRSACATK